MAEGEIEAVPLGDFVKQSIMEIAEAAQLDKTAVVNPVMRRANHSEATDAEFDVVVTASETLDKSAAGGAGAKFWVVTAEKGKGSIDKGSERSSTNRIKFKVAVALPSTPTEQYRDA
jgi:hypothetical protein